MIHVLAALLLACEPEPEPEGPGVVVLGPADVDWVHRGPIASGPRIAGTLEAGTEASLKAEVGGSVREVAAEVGQPVARDQPLVWIGGEELFADLAAAEAAADNARHERDLAERDLDRTATLVEVGAQARRDVEVARNALEAAKARVEEAEARATAARERTRELVVRAPFSGVVAERTVDVGDVVTPGTDLYTIVDLSTLRLEGAVPADAIGDARIGERILFEVQGVAGRTFVGRVARVSPKVDPTTRQLEVVAELANPTGQLVAGLFAEGRVARHLHEGLLVSIDAVDRDGPPTALRVRDGVIEEVAVDVGLIDEDHDLIEITAGLELGDMVLVSPPPDVAPGSRAEFAEALAPPDGA